MRLEIRAPRVPLDASDRQYIERQVRFAIGRFGNRVERSSVVLTDLNGPRGGIDKACRMEVRLKGGGVVVIEDRDGDVRAVVGRSASRLAAALQKQLERRRLSRHRRADLPSRGVQFEAEG